MSLALSVALLISILTVSICVANFNLKVHFYEFRNPLGLQCGQCESGGQPACCDNVERTENCIMTSPFTCDTRFRFMLRPFGAPVETAPSGGFPYFTRSNGGNSDTFNEGPGGFLAIPNPFTITNTTEWTGRIQFFIDALDSDVRNNETEFIVNRFPIDLELELGKNFTNRTTYTGIYSISDLGFDMSFRVQCSTGRDMSTNCTTCLQTGYNPSTDCTRCFTGLDVSTNCTTCLPGYDPSINCTQCVIGRDVSTNCTTCLPGYDPSTNCTQCLTGRDASTYCSQCLTNRDIRTSCTTCLPGYDPSTNCRECLPNIHCQNTSSTAATSTDASQILHSSNDVPLLIVTPAILGGVLGLSVIIIVILITVMVLVTKNREASQSTRPLPPEFHNRGGQNGIVDIEMKPNSLYDLHLTSAYSSQ